LRLVFHVSPDDDGTLSGTLDSLDQGAYGIPVATVLQDGLDVTMTVPSVGGGFEGTLSEDGRRIEGTWSQGPNQMPLAVEKTDELPQPERPQRPTGPFPYSSTDVTFLNTHAGIDLAGTLTVPEGGQPHPAVALISGSGPQNRNSTLFGHDLFWVLADHLTRNGIAVLRYDDRGVGRSQGSFRDATSEDFAADAEAAVEFLRSHPEVDPAGIGLVGHSEGGLIAPMVATRLGDLAFVVMLAGPGLPGDEILYLQGELIMKANGVPQHLIDKNRAAQEALYSAVREEPDAVAARTRLRRVFDEFVGSLTDRERAMMGMSGDLEQVINAQIATITSPWYRFFLDYDPATTLGELQTPVMALNGEKDLQVPPRQNLEAIERALKVGGNDDVTAREMPGLNHLFQTARTGAPSEYGDIAETFAPAALDEITEWILVRSR